MPADDAMGYRVASIEGQLQTVNERLRAVDRIDERLVGVMEDVAEIKETLATNAKDEVAARTASRRDLFALTGLIIAATIGAAATVVTQLPS